MSTVDEYVVDPLKDFYKQSVNLVRKCKKPATKEFIEIARATGQGFLIMGFIGFFVKIVHIPINHIIMTL